MVLDLVPPTKTLAKPNKEINYESILSHSPNTSYTEDQLSNHENKINSKNYIDLPTRLENLRPSRELLEFYRNKIAEYDDHHSDLLDRIHKIEDVCDSNMKLENDLKGRDSEISNLQKALSDLQAYLLEERDHVLRLYAENDRLKIGELDNKKKISHLLALAGPAAEECSYFLKDPPNHVSGIVPIKPDFDNKTQFEDRNGQLSSRTDTTSGISTTVSENIQKASPQPKKQQIIKQASGITIVEPKVADHKRKFPVRQPNGMGKHSIKPTFQEKDRIKHEKFGKKLSKINKIFDDRQILVLQIEALQSQLEEQTKLARDQISSLNDDRKIAQEEGETARKKDQLKLQSLNDTLRKTQNLLTSSTKDFLRLKNDHKIREKSYMSEKDSLCLQLEDLKDKLAGKNNYDPCSRKTAPPSNGKSKRRFTGGVNGTFGPALDLGRNVAARMSQEALKIRSLESSNQTLKSELEQAVKLADMFRSQYLKLQDDTAHIKEACETKCKAFSDKSERLTKRLDTADNKYKLLERRRATEVEGFKSDIKILRSRLKEMEKQILKISLGGPITDIEVLRDIHKQTSKSKGMQQQIRGLKEQIYTLESDFRHM